MARLTRQQIENVFRSVTIDVTSLSPDMVRLSWPTAGAPAWRIDEDVVFVQVYPVDDPYIQQREASYRLDTTLNMQRVNHYTRVHEVQWVCYGPNSGDIADSIRNGIYFPDTTYYLAQNHLYMILEVPAVTRLPELFNGQWWERSDLRARFNEDVSVMKDQPAITGVEVVIKTDTGQER